MPTTPIDDGKMHVIHNEDWSGEAYLVRNNASGLEIPGWMAFCLVAADQSHDKNARMRFDPVKNEFHLSTGRTFYAYGGTLSVDDDGALLYGSDGHVDDMPITPDGPEAFTEDERREIAGWAIDRWQSWAAPR